jgi:hypothetical protein
MCQLPQAVRHIACVHGGSARYAQVYGRRNRSLPDESSCTTCAKKMNNITQVISAARFWRHVAPIVDNPRPVWTSGGKALQLINKVSSGTSWQIRRLRSPFLVGKVCRSCPPCGTVPDSKNRVRMTACPNHDRWRRGLGVARVLVTAPNPLIIRTETTPPSMLLELCLIGKLASWLQRQYLLRSRGHHTERVRSN